VDAIPISARIGVAPAIGRSRRDLCLLQWMCPPKGVQRRTGTRRQRAPRKRGGEPGKGLPHPFPLPRHGRASIKGEGVTSKPYGAEGSIADGFGVCQYILTRPSPQRRGERRERREWGNGETAKRQGLHRRGAENAENGGNGGTLLRPPGYGGQAANDQRIRGEIPVRLRSGQASALPARRGAEGVPGPASGG